MAYEDSPARDNSRIKRKKTSLLRILVTAALFIVVTATVVVFVFYRDRLDSGSFRWFTGSVGFFKRSGTAQLSEFTFDSSHDNIYASVKDGLAVLSPDGLRIYDWSGKPTLFIPASYKNASLSASKAGCILYDGGGTSYTITNNYEILASGNTEQPILRGRHFDDGSYLIIAKEQGYKESVSVYDRLQNSIIKWYSSKKYIFDAVLSKNSDRLAVLCHGQESGRFVSSIILFDTKKTDPIAESVIMDSMVVSIGFFDDGSFCAIGEEEVTFFSPEGEKTGSYSYSGRKLRNFIIGGDRLALLLGRFSAGGHCELLTFDTGGALLGELSFDGEVLEIAISGGSTAVLCSGTVAIYDKDMKKLSETEEAWDVRDILMIDDTTVILIDDSSVKPFYG